MFWYILRIVAFTLLIPLIFYISFNVVCKIYDHVYAKRRVGRSDDREIKEIHTMDDLWLVIDKYHIPLERIRFFIGEDYKQPKAFGIYKDEESGDFIVYKNKANGERAIRYQGKDEDYAVNEIWSKLVSEAQKRGLGYMVGENDYVPSPNKAKGLFKIQEGNANYVRKRSTVAYFVSFAVLWISILSLTLFHISKNGYYMNNDDIYYRQGYTWYHYDGDVGDNGWVEYDGDTSDFEKVDRSDIDADYEYFENTDTYESYHEDRSDSDSDWDSWDSSDTDWDSDW